MQSYNPSEVKKLADLAEKLRKGDYVGIGQHGFNEYTNRSSVFSGPHGRYLKMTGDSVLGGMRQMLNGDSFMTAIKTQGRDLSLGVMGTIDTTGASGFGFGRDFAALSKSRGWQGIKSDLASGSIETSISSLGNVTTNGHTAASVMGEIGSALPLYGRIAEEGIGFVTGAVKDAKSGDGLEVAKDAAELAMGTVGALTGPVGEAIATGAGAALEVADSFRKNKKRKPDPDPDGNLTDAGKSNKLVNQQFTTGDFS